MSEIKSNKISPRKGTTTTIGDSGDSVTISSGTTTTNAGTISTAGITGGTINNTTGSIEGLQQQINWQTGDIKTASFTASANEGYFLNTTSGEITVTLPASPSAGDVVAVKDYADTFDTNKAILNANGNKIQGSTTNFDITVEGTAAILLYIDSTKGWLLVDQSKAADIAATPLFTVATGGTITTCGDYKIHTFTGPGTFTVTTLGNGPIVPTGGPNTASYAVIAGGGGGSKDSGGGGGAGGFREGRDITPSYTASPKVAPSGLTLTATAFPITVGAGGADQTAPNASAKGNPGSNSVFSTITSAGGGGGGSGGGVNCATKQAGENGGSGGGGGSGPSTTGSGGTGNTPPVSPPQGNNGGASATGTGNAGAGGGGANATGSNGSNPPRTGGAGGNGVATSITGSSVTRAGGGGGGGFEGGGGSAGSGGGGTGGSDSDTSTVGSANTGGGGGGGNGSSPNCGKAGGSGIVIIRYKFQ